MIQNHSLISLSISLCRGALVTLILHQSFLSTPIFKNNFLMFIIIFYCRGMKLRQNMLLLAFCKISTLTFLQPKMRNSSLFIQKINLFQSFPLLSEPWLESLLSSSIFRSHTRIELLLAPERCCASVFPVLSLTEFAFVFTCFLKEHHIIQAYQDIVF